jgi:hypothetical protein
MVPSAATLLSAWEAGAIEAPLDRAPSLLSTLGSAGRDEALRRLTVGECDTALFALRRQLFGDRCEAVAICPDCGEELELGLSLAELQPPAVERGAATGTLERPDYVVEFRVPRNDDLRLLGADALGCLIERCVVSARTSDGRDAAAAELPPQVQEAVAEAMATSDPGAQTLLDIRCPCGASWADEFDIRGVIWSDLTDWVGQMLTEVYELARSYGWSEAEVLALPTWRRRWYLEAAGW